METQLTIIGGGPAGLTAYIYAARARLKTILIDKLGTGGQVLTTDWVENYPGFSEGLSGYDLSQRFFEHAKKFGLEPLVGEVNRVSRQGSTFHLETTLGPIEAQAVIVATGARPNRLGIPGEEELTGKGVSYCATCDGPFFLDQEIAVVGGGNTAVQEALYLTRFAKKIYIIHRRDRLRAAKILQERALAHRKIEIIWDTVVEKIEGDDEVKAVSLYNRRTGQRSRLPVGGVFIFIGIVPQAEFVGPDLVDKDDRGFIITDSEMTTKTKGLFAAGDVRAKSCRQIVTACGDGATAAYQAEQYLDSLES
ncbi:thioredoxin-disulfide reductase [Thermosulfuriphilus sp.]